MTKVPQRALETDFPFEELQPVAELESWRKEINRPIYHVHKWWANRLGSVFRTILLAAGLEEGQDIWSAFYRRHDFRNQVVLDPFMGSGTTIGEALKLGYRAVGCDINPVATFQVRKALEPCSPEALHTAFQRLQDTVAPEICHYYRSTYHAVDVDVLYTFWVKILSCPSCGGRTRLFNRWVFAANAYPQRNPKAHAICPSCGEIVPVVYTEDQAVCAACSSAFNPHVGLAERRHFTCEQCHHRHQILDVVRRSGQALEHQMYALMLLLPNGEKVYKRPDDADRALYGAASQSLRLEAPPIPQAEILPGHNTDQARSYNYRYWHQMFNDRQLLTLGKLLQAILAEPDRSAREALLLLFSGTLEFNNMFCSFKGEGTGAVRHLFHHHILKPERTPLEANPWGTDRSSGSFSTLFSRRLLQAQRYLADPFELRVARHNGRVSGEKVFGINQPIRPALARSFQGIAGGDDDVLLLAGDSASLPLPDNSIDLVVTDPPYLDNVHYSELADFFHCWLQMGLDDPAFAHATSRSDREVQSHSAAEFGDLLGGVFAECARALKPDGLLAFTFHHSRNEAWLAVARAIERAGLKVVATHPVKAEMSVAVPKSQAKEPINLDLVVVCRHHTNAHKTSGYDLDLTDLLGEAESAVARFAHAGVRLSRGDVRVIAMGGFLRACSTSKRTEAQTSNLLVRLAAQVEKLYAQQEQYTATASLIQSTDKQLALDFS